MRNFKPLFLILPVILLGCAASMDLRMDELRSNPNWGRSQSSIPFEQFQYFTGEPEQEYVELAKLIVQETPQVILPRSSDEMITYMCKKAWKKGADAVINVSIETKNVAGYARTSAVVKGTAVKFVK